MPTIQETINKAVEIKGYEVLKTASLFINILEDLSPGLENEIKFVIRTYCDDAGRILYKACTASGEYRKEFFNDLDIFLDEECGLNEKWRKKFLSFFHPLVFGEESVPEVKKLTQKTEEEIPAAGAAMQTDENNIIDEARRKVHPFPSGDAIIFIVNMSDSTFAETYFLKADGTNKITRGQNYSITVRDWDDAMYDHIIEDIPPEKLFDFAINYFTYNEIRKAIAETRIFFEKNPYEIANIRINSIGLRWRGSFEEYCRIIYPKIKNQFICACKEAISFCKANGGRVNSVLCIGDNLIARMFSYTFEKEYNISTNFFHSCSGNIPCAQNDETDQDMLRAADEIDPPLSDGERAVLLKFTGNKINGVLLESDSFCIFGYNKISEKEIYIDENALDISLTDFIAYGMKNVSGMKIEDAETVHAMIQAAADMKQAFACSDTYTAEIKKGYVVYGITVSLDDYIRFCCDTNKNVFYDALKEGISFLCGGKYDNIREIICLGKSGENYLKGISSAAVKHIFKSIDPEITVTNSPCAEKRRKSF